MNAVCRLPAGGRRFYCPIARHLPFFLRRLGVRFREYYTLFIDIVAGKFNAGDAFSTQRLTLVIFRIVVL